MVKRLKDGTIIGATIGLCAGGVPGLILGGLGGSYMDKRMPSIRRGTRNLGKSIKRRTDTIIRETR